MEYRQLTEQEIGILESRGCKAQDWDLVTVKEGFDPIFIRNTSFYGNIKIGIFENGKQIIASDEIVNIPQGMDFELRFEERKKLIVRISQENA